MKRFLWLVLVLALAFQGCDKDDDGNGGGNGLPNLFTVVGEIIKEGFIQMAAVSLYSADGNVIDDGTVTINGEELQYMDFDGDGVYMLANINVEGGTEYALQVHTGFGDWSADAKMPGDFQITTPGEDAQLEGNQLEVVWTAAADAEKYLVELVNESGSLNEQVFLDADVLTYTFDLSGYGGGDMTLTVAALNGEGLQYLELADLETLPGDSGKGFFQPRVDTDSFTIFAAMNYQNRAVMGN